MTEFVTLKIPQGTLRGKRVTSSSNGVTYYSFQGIPYAKPPVGPLRFKPPEEPEPWTGTKDATAEGAVSPHIDIFTRKFTGNEDCLFLNVYTQQLKTTSPKAVMVWIHGGAFILGSGNTDLYGPDYLIAEDVILVTINYRLGALGFLYSENADIIGNNGLRDQVMALKWVKNNIEHFGGDPGNVTIFGASAGGISVHYLMLSPLASGLFHKAIAQSGTALLGTFYLPRDVMGERTKCLAKLFGCTSEDPKEMVNFLRTVSAHELIERQYETLSEEDKYRPVETPFVPCEEVGPEAFLPASPIKLIQEGKFEKVPFITGVTSAEGKLMLFPQINKVNLSAQESHFDALLPRNLTRNISNERSKEVAKTVKKFYFGDRDLSDDTVNQYIDLLSDLMFVYPLSKVVQMQNKWSQHPTYVYEFDHISLDGVELLPIAKNDHPGAPHGAEIPYLFKNVMTEKQSLGVVDSQVSTKLVKLWAQFVKTGNPSSEEANVSWTPTTNEKHNYLKINGGFNMCSDMYNKERITFLEELYIKFGIHERSD